MIGIFEVTANQGDVPEYFAGHGYEAKEDDTTRHLIQCVCAARACLAGQFDKEGIDCSRICYAVIKQWIKDDSWKTVGEFRVIYATNDLNGVVAVTPINEDTQSLLEETLKAIAKTKETA